MATRIKTFKDIYESVLNRMKLPTADSEALLACKEAINSRYDNICFRKKWRWRKARWDISVKKKYTTGTVAVTNDSRSITGTATVWTSDHVGWFFTVTGTDEVYEIIAIDTAAQTASLSSVYTGTTNAAASYTIYGNEYGLPPDCEEIDTVWHEHFTAPVDIKSPREIVEAIVGNPGIEGFASACTVWGFKEYIGPKLNQFLLNHDFLQGAGTDDLRLVLFPQVPDEDYTLHVMYQLKITALENDTDEPLIPIDKRHVLVYGAYADMLYRERLDETGQFWDTKYEALVREIEADAEYTDEKPRLIVRGKWHRARWEADPSSADLGSYFDRTYTPYD